MSTFSNEQLTSMKEKLLHALKDFDYRLKRYEVNYSIALGYSPAEIDLSPMAHYIRESDHFVILNHNTCAVIFDCTDEERGIKAANNLLTHFQGAFFSTPLYTSIVTASNYSATPQMLHDLFYLVNYAISHHLSNIVVEPSQLMQTH
jgi:hypothetical protein